MVKSETCETKHEIRERLAKQKQTEDEIKNRPVRSVTTEIEEQASEQNKQQMLKMTGIDPGFNSSSDSSIVEIEAIQQKRKELTTKEGEISPENIQNGITSIRQIEDVPTENKKCNAVSMQYCDELNHFIKQLKVCPFCSTGLKDKN